MSFWQISILAILALLVVIAIIALLLWWRFVLTERYFSRAEVRGLRDEIHAGLSEISRSIFSTARDEFRDQFREVTREFSPFSGEYDRELSDIIRRAERENNIRLTPGARQMLSIPIRETIEMDRDINWGEVYSSIGDLVHTAANQRSAVETFALGERVRSSITLVKGFHLRYCNIPPFCSRRDEDLR